MKASAHTQDAGTMRAAVIPAPGKVEMVEIAIPAPGPGKVRVQLEGCGVCASNLGPWAGPDWMKFPTAPGDLGHEGWGVVDAVGEDVSEYLLGRRVAMLSHNAFAEFDICDAAAIVELPASLKGAPVPAEPFGCAMNIFKRSDIRAGQTVAIIGIGFLGAILTHLASSAGARVIAISRRASSLALAHRMGAAETIVMDDHWRILDEVRDLTNGKFCERAIEAVGKQWPLDLAGELTRERGRLVIAGFHQDGARQVSMQLWNWRGIDVVNAHERDQDVYLKGMRDALRMLDSGGIDIADVVTHEYPLDRLVDALDATRDKPDGFVKAWVKP